MKRRDFLGRTSKAVALAAVTGGTGLLFHNRPVYTHADIVSKQTDFQIESAGDWPQVVLANKEDAVAALRMSLDGIGGIGRFVKKGERVTIKPNVGWDRTPEQAANTNPLLVGEMVSQCLAAGAARVVVTDVTCNEARRCFARSGIREAAEAAGGEVILPTEEDFVNADLGGELLTEWPTLRPIIECDRLINMPIVKQHSLSGCTIGMKNFYGIIGGRRHRLHQQIDQSIVDLARYCKPTLVVIDASRVLLRNGPQGGSLSDVATPNSVICATDQVAADTRAVEFLNMPAGRIGHFKLAEKSGLGTMDYRAAGYKELV
jgi:uncharacterized protein (DUF362 family)